MTREHDRSKLDELMESVDAQVPSTPISKSPRQVEFTTDPPRIKCGKCGSSNFAARSSANYTFFKCKKCGWERKVNARPKSRFLKRFGYSYKQVRPFTQTFRNPDKNR